MDKGSEAQRVPEDDPRSSIETAVRDSSPDFDRAFRGNLFIAVHGKDDSDASGSPRWSAGPNARAGDVFLFLIRREGLTYAAWAVSNAIGVDDETMSVELDEHHWRRIPNPIAVRELRRLPQSSGIPARVGKADDAQTEPLRQPLVEALLAVLEERDPGFRDWLGEPPYLEETALFRWLGRTARDALGRADGIRAALRQDKIHMEHLLFGLLDGGASHIQRLFRKHDLDEAELRGLLAARKPRIPDQFTPTDLKELPPLSSHVRGALAESFATPRLASAHTLESRHLFYGALSITDCSAVKALAGRGLGKDEIEIVPRDRVDWVLDTPAEEDLLGRRPFAKSLARRLKRINDDPRSTRSFLIHLDGPWGAGKSTLLRFLEEELFELHFTTLQLNAWREQRIGPPWWSLLTALWRHRRESARGLGRIRAWFQDIRDRIRINWVLFLTAMLVISGLAVGLFFLVGPDLDLAGQRAESIASLVALGVTVLGGAIAASRFLLVGSAQGASFFVRANDNPMQGILSQFGRTLDRIDEPVVYFIDDLDRCTEAYVVEFLESVQTLVRDSSKQGRTRRGGGDAGRTAASGGGPYFVVAADERWIRASYEKTYETFRGTHGAARPLGSLFVDKIFQLTVRLPRITEKTKAAYLAQLLGQNTTLTDAARSEQVAKLKDIRERLASADDEAEALEALREVSEVHDPVARLDVLGEGTVRLSDEKLDAVTEHVLQPFARFLDGNPRTIRRFVNAYGVLRAQRTLEEEFVETDPLALWTVLQLQWPVLADYLRAHPEQVNEFGEEEPKVSDELRDLFADREIIGVVRDEEHGFLTPDLVRACGGPPIR